MEAERSLPHSQQLAAHPNSEQKISPRPRQLWTFHNMAIFYGEELLAPLPNPRAGVTPLVGCPRLLIQCIHSYPPYWRPFLHTQPEDAPCRGERDPLIMEWPHISVIQSQNILFPDDGNRENLRMITGLYLCQKSIKAQFNTVPGTKSQTNAIILNRISH